MDVTTIDASTISFGTPFTQQNGQKIVPFSLVPGRYNYQDRIRLQLGRDQDNMCHSNYGLNKPMQGSDPNRRNMDINLTPEMESAFRAFDEFVTKTCAERSQEFFKTPTLTKQYMPMVRVEKDGRKVLRVKVNCGDRGTTEVRVLRPDNTTIVRTFNDIPRDAQLLVVVDTPGIWSNPTQFGVAWTARGVIVKSSPSTNGLNMFSNLSPGIKDVVETEEPVNMEDD